MRLRYWRQCGFAQGVVEDAHPLFEGAGGLEEGRDLDLVGDPVMAREPEGGEQGVAGLGLGDEEAHGVRAVHVLEDLGDGHHQPGGRGALGGQRPEIHVHRLHVVQECVDGGQMRATLGGVGGLALEIRDAAHRVVDLARVEPEVRQRVREAVGGDARAQERHRAPVRVRFEAPDGAGEPGQERARIGLGALALDDEGQREAVHRLQRRLGAEAGRHRELAVHGGERVRGQVAHHLRGGQPGQVAHHPVELHPLRFEAVAQGVPPADIGAPVRVAADPARDGEGPGHQFGPAVGPAGAGGVEQGGVEGVERRAAVIGRQAGLVELVVEADLRVRPRGEIGGAGDQRRAGRRVARARGLGDQRGDGAGHAEGRVRREHHREAGAADQIPERLEIAGAFRHGGDEAGRHPGVGGALRVPVEAHIGAQALGAGGERLPPQAGNRASRSSSPISPRSKRRVMARVTASTGLRKGSSAACWRDSSMRRKSSCSSPAASPVRRSASGVASAGLRSCMRMVRP